ncbi:MAG: hypothetical protein C0176_02750 [Mesoaciditoga sp.]|uniref:bifunctional 5,10-methylenetetrahydrofolate dehydrogenase/5,10-methenyltetrahydrofolate cyclohydrolase n=1 Tax=Athalassotoga sp. TaxID=2022597 RepID=UPI000CB5E8FB|nr:MAG: hypothetical protein C0185_01350 [Mesoaciditoga sp.]PMP80349.1 MAG: hypothetical protein C0176_02750 [Mesoaciditoga sp.]HEU25026.1 bifunctional 5,10-methylenetetrahydrofolate dehydrogenase/5,10-methenyltetrahydrofolate cyclohydrolase [Mesoaciditoga lauensis]
MIFDGIEIAENIKKSVAQRVENLKSSGIFPALRCVVSSDDKSTRIYLNSIKKNCQSFGIDYSEVTVNEKNIFEKIKELNSDKKVHGIMLMHPVPSQIEEFKVLSLIDPLKDVEGRTPQNLGMLIMGKAYFTPCTAEAVVEMLKYYRVPLAGKNVTIVGRSTTVGKPLSLLLIAEDATVTVCHSKTVDLIKKVKEADIVVTAVGKPKMFDEKWFGEGSTIIDVGINVVNGKVVGDVDFDSVSHKVSISKVPGGVGNVTSAILMRNVINATELICKT